MKTGKYDENRLLHLLLDMGEMLLASGAEINRVEDTLQRIGRAYGAAKMNVFVITSSIVITMEKTDGELLTHTRRINYTGSTDFTMLEQLNALSRNCCIMLLIPGIPATNSIRDMLMGDTISGLMRLIESILWAGALACGFMAAIWMVRV